MVCVALLCAAQTSAPLHDTAQHLLGFLIDGPMPGDSLAHPDAPDTGLKLSTLLADILSALSTAARASTTFPDTTGDDIFQTSKAAACLQSLVQLLEWAAKAATTECKPVLSQWFRSTIADASEPYPSSVLLELLPVVVPALRSSEELLIDSGLPELTQQLMHRSDQLPPLAVMCQTPDPETLTSILQTLDTICACFPCPSTPLVRPSSAEQHTTAVERRFEAVATAAEKQALLAVTLRQMRGERTVAMAAAAARRATEGREAETSTATTSGQYVLSLPLVSTLSPQSLLHKECSSEPCVQDSSHAASDTPRMSGRLHVPCTFLSGLRRKAKKVARQTCVAHPFQAICTCAAARKVLLVSQMLFSEGMYHGLCSFRSNTSHVVYGAGQQAAQKKLAYRLMLVWLSFSSVQSPTAGGTFLCM